MNEIKTARIGKGKAVHALFTAKNGERVVLSTLCQRNFGTVGASLPVECDATEVTCKKCLKEIAALVEADHAEALYMSEVLDTALQNVAGALDRLHAEALAEDVERAHAEVIKENADRHISHMARWFDGEGVRHYCDVRVPYVGIPWRDGSHEGPCYDAVTGTWREQARPSAKQRRAARRVLRAALRKQAAQGRAAARARRAKRGAARATAKTLLVAAGVPQDVAERYAPAFSRGVQAPTVAVRMPLCGHRSKRVEVKRYTWEQFQGRLKSYRPANHLAHLHFEHAAAKVTRMA